MKNALILSGVLNVALLLVVTTAGFLFAEHKIVFVPKPVPTAAKPQVQSVVVNKSWDLPATVSAKTTFTLTITKVEKSDTIISGGKKFSTKNNKSFLIVNTVSENKGTKDIALNPSDFIKLSDNNQEVEALYKALPATVAAGKSYDSSMVFLIDESAKSETLSVGTNVKSTSALTLSF